MFTEIQITSGKLCSTARYTQHVQKGQIFLYFLSLKITSKHKLSIYSVFLYFSKTSFTKLRVLSRSASYEQHLKREEGMHIYHFRTGVYASNKRHFSPMEKMDENQYHFMKLYNANYTE